MSAPLVYIEVLRGEPSRGSLGLVGKARAIAGSAFALVCGPEADAVAATLARFGATNTYWCNDRRFDPELSQPQVDAIAFLIERHGFDTVLFENSVVASDIAAGLSARFDSGVNWDLMDVELVGGDLIGLRLALDDTVEVRVGWRGNPRLAVFRLGRFEPDENPVSGRIVHIEPEPTGPALRCRVVERSSPVAKGAQLGTADIIVAGGRGVRDRESLQLLEDLADALGGTVAVSMPLVDNGWYSHMRQVGLTGQKVHPRLYLACGISGALGHRVGMEKSQVIVAINTDERAPIFGICNGGVVGDLHKIVPELTRLVRQAQPSAPPLPSQRRETPQST